MSDKEMRELMLSEIREMRKDIQRLAEEVATLKAAGKIQSSIFGGLAGFAPFVFEKLFNK